MMLKLKENQMYRHFFDYVFYRVNFTYYRILNVMSGLTPAESERRWDDLPMDLKKSFYEEMPGIAILSSFQLLNIFPILSLAAWLVNYDNKDYINVAVMILGAIFFVYDIYRYKVLVSYIELHEKWRNKSSTKRLSITKTYALITIIAFFLSLWLVN